MTKDLEFALKQMHAMSSIHLPIKSFTLEEGMKMYVIHIDEIVLNNESCLIANDVNDSWFGIED